MRVVWYVYLYRRPDGSVFYVGKGKKDRAVDIAPTRRSAYFLNVVRKYGRDNISLELIPCETEPEAFAKEREYIARLRLEGATLVNLTDGGDGCSGRPLPEKSRAAFTEWQGAYHRLSDQAKRAVLDGLKIGRINGRAWKQSPIGQAHLKALGEAGRIRLHSERVIGCIQCGITFNTHSAKAQCCSRRCEQRHRRAHGPIFRKRVIAQW